MLKFALQQVRDAASASLDAVRFMATSSHGLSTLFNAQAVQHSSQAQSTVVPRSVRMQQAFANKRALSHSINPAHLFTNGQVMAIQVTACVLAGISLFGSLVAFYWFCQMRKKFRHRLIMLLIVADLIRSTSLLVFPIVSLSIIGSVPTSSPFCQLSGFFTQAGIEMADFAVLAIAIHTALQIFKPTVTQHTSSSSESGLYRYRYAVYVLIGTLPATMCSLAFIRKTGAYMSQGPICSLPLRPFWYRLAISWIPRYTIVATIAGLYIAIYIHVRGVAGMTSTFRRRSPYKLWEGVVAGSKGSNKGDHDDGSPPEDFGFHPAALHMRNDSIDPTSPMSGIGAFSHAHRKNSSISTMIASRIPSVELGRPDSGVPASDRGSPLAIYLDGFWERRMTRHSAIKTPVISTSQFTSSSNASQDPELVGKNFIAKETRSRHDAIQHQLRLLFAYPLCYFVMWIMPFVSHSCNYNNYLVQHPIFAIQILSFASVSAMGAVDSFAFSLRERPWRHITGSDGTFFGSFLFWRFDPSRRSSNETDTTVATDNRSAATFLPSRNHSWAEASVRQGIMDDIDQGVQQQRASLINEMGSVSGGQPRWQTSGQSPSSGTTVSRDFAMGGRGSVAGTGGGLDRELYWINRRLSGALLRQGS